MAMKKKANGKGYQEAVVEQESTAVPVETFPDLKDVMDEYCHEYRALADEARAIEERRRELSDVIMELVNEARCDSIVGDSYHVVKVRQTRRTLSETKLLENGVEMDIIDKCKTATTTEYIQVRAI